MQSGARVIVALALWAASPGWAAPTKLTVLWPRIIPSAQAEKSATLAADVQRRAEALVKRLLPERALDLRPSGERSCPEAGCPGGSVGVLLLRQGDGCGAVALFGVPGRAHLRLVVWVGVLELKKFEVDFRDPPESQVTIRDLVPCSELLPALEQPNPDIERALRDVHGR